MEQNNLLDMKSISKRFGGMNALDKVDFDLRKGETHALVGENGAGKSTLMKILNGVIHMDSGRTDLMGKKIEIYSPVVARKNGIAMIYQELSLVEDIDVASNIYLGQEPVRQRIFLDNKKIYQQATELLKTLELNIRPTTLVRSLTVGQKQMIEIAKAFAADAQLIIMDEPSSALSMKDKQELFEGISTLKKKNVSIIYISHKLDEIMEISDRITILRDGRKIGTFNTTDIDQKGLVQAIIGRDLEKEKVDSEINIETSRPILSMKGISASTVPEISNIDLELYHGEVLGLTGLMGAGKSEVAKVLFGITNIEDGKIEIDGKEALIKTPYSAVFNGIGLIPENRREEGLIMGMSIQKNIIAVCLPKLKKNGRVDKKKANQIVSQYISQMGIKTRTMDILVKQLSGGNQQKVVIGKWLANKPKIIILDEPTRGIDVGSKAEIHKLIRKLANEGVGVLLVSSEIPEILTCCDRILIMRRGRIVQCMSREQATEESIYYYSSAGNDDDTKTH